MLFQIPADDMVSSLGNGVQDGVQKGWKTNIVIIKQDTDNV